MMVSLPIVVTLMGIVTDVMGEYSNALPSIIVILLGMITLVIGQRA